MKIYLAGKITGELGYEKKFADAAEYIQKRLDATVISPAVLPKGLSNADYMRICFAMIDSADMVVFLPDWSNSSGARLEMCWCEYTAKPFEVLCI